MAPRRPFQDRPAATYLPSPQSVPEENAINVRGRTHELAARVDDPDVPATLPPRGVLLAMGTVLGGWSFHLLDGRLRYVSNYVGRDVYVVESEVVRRARRARADDARSTPAPTSPAPCTLLVDGEVVGAGEIARTTPVRHSISGAGHHLRVGAGPARRPGLRRTVPVHRHAPPQSSVEIEGVIHRDPEAELESIFSEQ